ncbi:hypothetical protein NBRC116601_13700 [Cognatishimia sp. WU-CL00825]|uniref:hypothetical protein n=1 Tax=Cognatishimia sp. WU-CL00825 TaxID=3127658 RepID=UPI0031062725
MLKDQIRLVCSAEDERAADMEALKNLIEYSIGCAKENEFSATQFILEAALRSLEEEDS